MKIRNGEAVRVRMTDIDGNPYSDEMGHAEVSGERMRVRTKTLDVTKLAIPVGRDVVTVCRRMNILGNSTIVLSRPGRR